MVKLFMLLAKNACSGKKLRYDNLNLPPINDFAVKKKIEIIVKLIPY